MITSSSAAATEYGSAVLTWLQEDDEDERNAQYDVQDGREELHVFDPSNDSKLASRRGETGPFNGMRRFLPLQLPRSSRLLVKPRRPMHHRYPVG